MNHYLFLLSSQWSLLPISPLQTRAVGQMSQANTDTCVPDVQPHMHTSPRSLFQSLLQRPSSGSGRTGAAQLTSDTTPLPPPGLLNTSSAARAGAGGSYETTGRRLASLRGLRCNDRTRGITRQSLQCLQT